MKTLVTISVECDETIKAQTSHAIFADEIIGYHRVTETSEESWFTLVFENMRDRNIQFRNPEDQARFEEEFKKNFPKIETLSITIVKSNGSSSEGLVAQFSIT